MQLTDFRTCEYSLVELVKDSVKLEVLRRDLGKGVAFKIKHDLDLELLNEIRCYLLNIKNSSFANFVARNAHTPNHFRIHWQRPEQEVLANFCSWSFFALNEDPFEIFQTFKNVFELRNLLAGRSANSFLSGAEDGFVARFAAQFYQSGRGFMEKHQDPVAVHQFAIPTILLSTPGVDFKSGGAWAESANNQRFYIDKELDFGDLFLFHSQIPHGVELIDPDTRYSGLSDSGRLMAIFAVNSL